MESISQWPSGKQQPASCSCLLCSGAGYAAQGCQGTRQPRYTGDRLLVGRSTSRQALQACQRGLRLCQPRPTPGAPPCGLPMPPLAVLARKPIVFWASCGGRSSACCSSGMDSRGDADGAGRMGCRQARKLCWAGGTTPLLPCHTWPCAYCCNSSRAGDRPVHAGAGCQASTSQGATGRACNAAAEGRLMRQHGPVAA